MLQSLYENPWPIMLALVAAGVVLFVVGQRRANTRLLIAGACMFVLAGGSLLLAGLIETDREAIDQAARKLVNSTAPLDLQALGALLDDGCTVSVADRAPDLAGADAIQEAVYNALNRYKVKSHTVRELESRFIEPQFGRTQLRLRTAFESGQIAITRWELSWRRDDTGRWLATDLRFVELNNGPPGNVLSSFR